jgi:DNA-binding MarR family transcriptional regulator
MGEHGMKFEYLELVVLAERMHRQFLDVIQHELDMRGIRDINNVQALMLHNIGDAEMTVSELMWRGCYLGSNVSYSLKKLTETAYVVQERSMHDKRVIMVRLSEKGKALFGLLKNMNARHLEGLNQMNLKNEDIAICRQTLRGLQQFWSRSLDAAMLSGLMPIPVGFGGTPAPRSQPIDHPRRRASDFVGAETANRKAEAL